MDTITILERFGRLSGLGKETEMKRDEVLAILAAHREPLQRLGVKSLTLFGSVARDEARPDSDVDLLVEQELACEIVYAPHYLKFEHSIIWAN